MGGRHRSHDMAARLAAMTSKGPACWTFLGAPTGANGYSLITRNDGSRLYAHRAAWELAHGPIRAGLKVCHRCDNPRCVNPSHLFLGTQADNVHASIHKGRFNCFGRQKLNAKQVLEIRRLARLGRRHQDIAARFGVARNTITGIVHRKSWAHLPEVS